MSSLARRTLHITAAVAGIAALGAGLAGNAFAAPAPSQSVPTTEVAPGPSTESPAGSLAGVAGTAGRVVDSPALPALFAFESPLAHAPAVASAIPASTDVASTGAQNRTTYTETTTVNGQTRTRTTQTGPTSSGQDADGPLTQVDGRQVVGDVVNHAVGSPQAVTGSTLGLPLG
jgi:hypothetical protein